MSASFFDSQSLFCSSYFNRLKEVSELIFVVVGFLLQYSSKLLFFHFAHMRDIADLHCLFIYRSHLITTHLSVCPVTAVLGWTLVKTHKHLTGCSCHQSWTPFCHWPVNWWDEQRCLIPPNLINLKPISAEAITITQSVCLSVSACLFSGRWWIQSAGCSGPTHSSPHRVSYLTAY